MLNYLITFNLHTDTVITRLLFALSWIKRNEGIFRHLDKFLIFVFSNISKFSNYQINFLIISNFSITAGFLSRYISRKLQQGYGVMELLNPISRELRLNCKFGKLSIFDHIKKNIFDEKVIIKSAVYKKNLFRVFLLNFSNLNNFLHSAFFKYTSSFFTLNFLEILLNFSISLKIYLSLFKFLFLLDFPTVKFKLLNLNYVLFITLLYFSCEKIFFLKFRWLLKNNNYIFTLKTYNYYMYNQYWLYNYNWLYSVFKLNRNKAKLDQTYSNKVRLSSFIGFRFQCKGRFSKKPRSNSVLIRENKIPLNTLQFDIDYGFYTSAIKNSACGVKVWLSKYKNSETFFLLAN